MSDIPTMQEIVDLYRQLCAYNRALDDQRDLAIRAAAQMVSDDAAAAMPLLYPAWDWRTCTRDMIVNYNGRLSRVVTPPTDGPPPDADGMLAVSRTIVPAHTGTQDDPIPWVYGMDCRAGMYYTHDGQVWLCLSDMAPCVWAPGSDPAMWVAA